MLSYNQSNTTAGGINESLKMVDSKNKNAETGKTKGEVSS